MRLGCCDYESEHCFSTETRTRTSSGPGLVLGIGYHGDLPSYRGDMALKPVGLRVCGKCEDHQVNNGIIQSHGDSV